MFVEDSGPPSLSSSRVVSRDNLRSKCLQTRQALVFATSKFAIYRREDGGPPSRLGGHRASPEHFMQFHEHPLFLAMTSVVSYATEGLSHYAKTPSLPPPPLG